MVETTQTSSWKISYTEGCIPFIEAFRRDLWDYTGVADALKHAFHHLRDVNELTEMGSGAGTNLIELARRGFRCTGYDSNFESVELARSRTKDAGENVEFHHLDFMVDMPDRTFDAVLSLFVPISKTDMSILMSRTHNIIRPRGYFACMLLMMDKETQRPFNNIVHTSEQLDVDEFSVVRLNYFTLKGSKIYFKGVYYVTAPDMSVRSFVDIDTYDLLAEDEMLHYDTRKFRHVDRIRIHGKPDQCPPMSYEVIDIFQAH